MRLNAKKTDYEQSRNPQEKERLLRAFTSIRNEWIDCQAKIFMNEYHEKYTYLFHTHHNIKALKKCTVRTNHRETDEYYAYIETESGDKITKRVTNDFIMGQLDPTYLKYFEKHHNAKGWICFDKNDNFGNKITDPNFTSIRDELEPSYMYSVNRDGDHILYIRLNLVVILNHDRTCPEDTYIYDAESVKYFYKTHRSKYYKPFDNRNEVEQYFKACDVEDFFVSSFGIAQGEQINNRLNISRSHDRYDPDYNQIDQGRLNKVQMFYLNTRSFGIKIQEHLQISRIRFNIHNNSWEGVQREDGSEFEITKLSEKWVKRNFPQHWQTFLTISRNGMQKFLSVPVGDIIEVTPTMDTSMNPVLKYVQSSKDICVFASLGSYLHYYGYVLEAETVFNLKDEHASLFKNNPARILQTVMELIQTISMFKNFRRIYQFIKLDKNHNIFQDKLRDGEFKIIIIRSDDNHMSHAVCLNNQYIFDCNSPKCLPMSVEGINCSCGKKYNFVGIKLGYYFQFRPTKKNLKKKFI